MSTYLDTEFIIRNEMFTGEERLEGLALKRIPHIDDSELPALHRATAKEVFAWWRGESKRWIDEYTKRSAEIEAYNPFRDQDVLASLRDELADIAENVAESGWALLASLDQL